MLSELDDDEIDKVMKKVTPTYHGLIKFDRPPAEIENQYLELKKKFAYMDLEAEQGIEENLGEEKYKKARAEDNEAYDAWERLTTRGAHYNAIEKAQRDVDAARIGLYGWSQDKAEIDKYLSDLDEAYYKEVIDRIGLEDLNAWAKETGRTEVDADTPMHHTAYLIGKIEGRVDNSERLAARFDDLYAAHERRMENLRDTVKWVSHWVRDSAHREHAASPFGDDMHEIAMSAAITSAIRKGHKGILWAKDPYLVAKVENWSAPKDWKPEASGDNKGKYMAGGDRTPQVTRIIKDTTEYMRKVIAKKYGGEVTEIKVFDDTVGETDMYYFEFTPKLIHQARSKGLNMTRAIAPIGLTPALQQMYEMQNTEEQVQ
jgi:hypothetical protein